jgi:hypothetical protein
MTGKILTHTNLAEAVRVVNERHDELSKLLYVEGDAIIFQEGGDYEIPLDRCDTHEKIIARVLHLSGKNWVTLEHIVRFITLATHENKLSTAQNT